MKRNLTKILCEVKFNFSLLMLSEDNFGSFDAAVLRLPLLGGGAWPPLPFLVVLLPSLFLAGGASTPCALWAGAVCFWGNRSAQREARGKQRRPKVRVGTAPLPKRSSTQKGTPFPLLGGPLLLSVVLPPSPSIGWCCFPPPSLGGVPVPFFSSAMK